MKPEAGPRGFRITFDWSLLLMLITLAWGLGFRFLPRTVYMPSGSGYAVMGLAGALGIVLSILWHELGHAAAARRCGLQIRRIHLYALGGLAELRHRPVQPGHEMLVAAAGPFFSLLLAGTLYTAGRLAGSTPAGFMLGFLASANLFISLFNLLPVYPLDGGRLLRGLLWRWKPPFAAASAVTYRFSSFILAGLSVASVVLLAAGIRPLGYWTGIWAFYLGYMALKAKPELFRGPDVRDMLFPFPVSAPVKELLEWPGPAAGRAGQVLVPVFAGDALVGVLNAAVWQETGAVELFPLGTGRYLDLQQPFTWSGNVVWEADYVPALDGNRYLGLADAHEMRFWLLQGFHGQIRDARI